eukprot:TRINITY_DN2845_c0_g1_i5.p1 TRINITY_DN2845_c0_g1~~TRINITY_DN2845_c0_g1_i5.p1  ORF type:complete len:287 (+),score=41.52 TRINITY_DN2845_c0_g1_i5:217-1077(+)
MNKSIRSKLFLSITILLLLFICAVWILNNLYLNQYYINNKKNILEENAKNIVNMYTGDLSGVQDELDRISNIIGGNIDIFDEDKKLVYKSSRRLPMEKNIIDTKKIGFKNNIEPPPNLLEEANKHGEFNNLRDYSAYSVGTYTFESRRDMQLNIDFLTLVTKLNNGDLLTLRVPLISIQESVDIANRFIFIIGVIIVAFGSLVAFLFSKKFTKPILEVNDIAQNMAKFDFSQKCKIKGKDEIGQLSQSINYLSCLLYTSDAADDTPCVDLGGRRIIKKKKKNNIRA